jgi:hypothetical protein
MSIRESAQRRRSLVAMAVCVVVVQGAGLAQSTASRQTTGWSGDPPVLASLVDAAKTESDLRLAVDRYLLDKAAIERRYDVPYSPVRHARLKTFYQGWKQRVAEADFGAFNPEGRIDYLLLRNRIEYDIEMLALADRRWTEMATLIPFFDSLRQLQEDRFDRKRADGRATATNA